MKLLIYDIFSILPPFFRLESKYSPQRPVLKHDDDDDDNGVRFPAGAGNFSLNHRIQNGSGAHPASYPIGTRGSFPWGKAAGA
jgi:hypothetical protein